MSTIFNFQTLYSSSSAATGTTYLLGSRWEGAQVRSFLVSKDTNDVVSIQVSLDNTNYATALSYGSGVTTGIGNVEGNWRFVRAVKSGENGLAIVQGMI